jgi:hypothetical protein
MNQQRELKLGMIPDEVKEILGEPDDIKKDEWGAFTFYFMTIEGEENVKIRFVRDNIVHITRWSKNLNWDGDE